jgi:CheY-like chemotaxis protein
MPGEDGYSLIQRVRALSSEEGGEIPAIALTAYARPEDHERSLLAGFQMHIAKPVDPSELVVMVASLAGPEAGSGRQWGLGTAATAASKPTPNLKRILLVEDDEPTRETLKKLLDRRGYEVVAVASLAEARSAAESGEYDLVISDFALPDGTGTELMAELRSRFGLKGIALSGYGGEEDLARSREAGFIAHLTKPVAIGSLEEALGLAAPTAAPDGPRSGSE